MRALYVAIPPTSQELPPGDRAVLITDGDSVAVALVSGEEVCGRLRAPDFILQMLMQVGEGENGKAPGVDN